MAKRKDQGAEMELVREMNKVLEEERASMISSVSDTTNEGSQDTGVQPEDDGVNNKKKKDDVNKAHFIELLQTEELYPNSLVRDPRNVEDYQPVLDIAVGMMYAAIAIFIASMIFVLVSSINLRISNMRNEIGIIETLGEDKKYMFKVLILEMLPKNEITLSKALEGRREL